VSRLVEARPRGSNAFSGKPGENAQGYLTRVAQYVPAEILAAYLFLVPTITATTSSGTLRIVLLGLTLVGLGILNVPYLVKMAKPDQPKVKHIVVSSVAYVTWTYAIGGFWSDIHLYQAGVAAAAIVLVSIASGIVIPYKGDR
jgi:hypothetical protein